MSAAARRPNLFIVGAPKSGTTALWSYLSTHPEIYSGGAGEHQPAPASGTPAPKDRGVPQGKEYYYFGSDLPSNNFPRRSLETYLASFAGATDERYLIDASPMYLCSTRAASEIAEFSPDARAIAMLRNPIDMMYSLHGEAFFNGDEDIADFEEALEAEDDRRRGERIPPTCQGALWSLFYRDVARYADQLERFFDALGRERVHVIVYDDFAADPSATYRSALAFLGLEPDAASVPAFAVVNAHTSPRSRLVIRLLRNPPPLLRTIGRGLVRNQGTRRALGLQVQQLNAQRLRRQPLRPELRRTLQDELAGDIRRLESLLGRDLSAWTRDDSSEDTAGDTADDTAGATEDRDRRIECGE